MKWVRFKLKTLTDAEDIVISSMYDIGLLGAQIEDNVPLTSLEKEQMFVDIPLESGEDDGTAFLSFFVEEDEDGLLTLSDEKVTKEEVERRIKEEMKSLSEFMEVGEGSIAISETEDLDWINNWKKYFHQFYIDDLLVIPSWEEVKPEDRGKKILHIDPGTAFGTGMHETTQLCVRQIWKYMNGDTNLLDIGTGSGILAIVALMYGIKHAVGTDLDPCAITACGENMEVNGIGSDKFEVMIGNLISDSEVQDRVGREKYDIVVANILPDVLVPLMPAAKACLKKGGVYITSGIIEGKENLVADTMRSAGLVVDEITSQGEWRCVTGHLPE